MKLKVTVMRGLEKMNHLYIQAKLNDLDNSFSKTRSFTAMNGALYVYVD